MQEQRGKIGLVKDWLNEFLADHRRRFPEDGWPAEGSAAGRQLWGRWFEAFRAAGVGRAEADAASLRFAGERLEGEVIPCREHPALIAQLGLVVRAEAAHRAATRPAERDAAARAEARKPVDDPIVLPEGVADYREYWRYLLSTMFDGRAAGGPVHAPDGRVRGKGA